MPQGIPYIAVAQCIAMRLSAPQYMVHCRSQCIAMRLSAPQCIAVAQCIAMRLSAPQYIAAASALPCASVVLAMAQYVPCMLSIAMAGPSGRGGAGWAG